MNTIAPFTPVQYVIGKAEFCGFDIAVDERVLIPRPETELLVETAIDVSYGLRITGCGLRILDLCTGSGCVAIALTKRLTDCKIIASDISKDALAVARINAAGHRAGDRLLFINSDLFEGIDGSFDIIVSNPPYIARHEFAGLQKEVLKEPRIALDGGDDGLDYYRRIAMDAPAHLRDGGYLALEIGFGQARAVKDILEEGGLLEVIDVNADQNGIDRVVIARKSKWIN